MKRKLLAALLCGAMLTTLAPVQTVFAEEPVPVTTVETGSLTVEGGTNYIYIDENGEEQIPSDGVTLLDENTKELKDGWYVAQGEIGIDSRVTVKGNVHLILLDDSKLTVNGGIEVPKDNSLTIYGQEKGNGTLEANAGDSGDAGIGGTKDGQSDSGTVTINGGIINATGHTGIGGSQAYDWNYEGGHNGTVIINGGRVTAIGTYGSGIGGGVRGGPGENGGGGTVTIKGGYVYAKAGGPGSGIGGGGEGANSATVNISGNAVVVAIAGNNDQMPAIDDNDVSSYNNSLVFEQKKGQTSLSGKMTGDVTISEDLELPENATLEIPDGSTLTISKDTTLTIPDSTTLTIPEGSTLTNNGTIANDGTIAGQGTLTGEGALQGNGKVNVGENGFAANIDASAETSTLTYGDSLKITGSITSKNNSQEKVGGGTVTLFNNDAQLTEPVTVGEDGNFAITYDTAEKGILITENDTPLTVKYSGGNWGECSANVDVTLARKPVTAAVDGTISKTHDQSTSVNVKFKVTEGLEEQDVITGSAGGNFADANVGEGKSITVKQKDVTWSEDGKWYDITLPSNIIGTITPSGDVNPPETNPDPVPPTPPTYRPEISESEGGTVSVTPKRPEKGDEVTITPQPDDGYEVDKVIVTDKKGNELDVTEEDDGTFTFTQPIGRVTITVTYKKTETPEPTPSVSDIFVDVAPDAWYVDAVQFAYDEGIMTGTSDTTFSPELTTTRGMIVAILHRLEDSPAASDDRFTDVGDGDWYAEAVNWAASEGIVNGTSATTFAPNAPITREQLAAILYNYAEYKGMDTSARTDLSIYSDAASISDWAQDVLSWANAEGLVNGVTDTTIAPQEQATRGQVAAIFERFLSN